MSSSAGQKKERFRSDIQISLFMSSLYDYITLDTPCIDTNLFKKKKKVTKLETNLERCERKKWHLSVYKAANNVPGF